MENEVLLNLIVAEWSYHKLNYYCYFYIDAENRWKTRFKVRTFFIVPLT